MGSVEDSGAREIVSCPFKGRNAPIFPVCPKTRQDCVGEDACPDMQTHKAVMRALGILESAVRKGLL